MIIPKAFREAPATKTEAKFKLEAQAKQNHVRARIDMSAEVAGAGLCPECRKPMEEKIVNGHPALVCMEDRITIPKKDEEVPNVEERTQAVE